MISNPPIHGARIAAKILGDSDLRQKWFEKKIKFKNIFVLKGLPMLKVWQIELFLCVFNLKSF